MEEVPWYPPVDRIKTIGSNPAEIESVASVGNDLQGGFSIATLCHNRLRVTSQMLVPPSKVVGSDRVSHVDQAYPNLW